jgi:hypothetical protein
VCKVPVGTVAAPRGRCPSSAHTRSIGASTPVLHLHLHQDTPPERRGSRRPNVASWIGRHAAIVYSRADAPITYPRPDSSRRTTSSMRG